MTKYIDEYELSKKNVEVPKFIIIFTKGGHKKIYEIGLVFLYFTSSQTQKRNDLVQKQIISLKNTQYSCS